MRILLMLALLVGMISIDPIAVHGTDEQRRAYDKMVEEPVQEQMTMFSKNSGKTQKGLPNKKGPKNNERKRRLRCRRPRKKNNTTVASL